MRYIGILLVAFLFANSSFSQTLHHNLFVEVDITSNSIDVTDSIKIPVDFIHNTDEIYFFLNNKLQLNSLDSHLVITKIASNVMDSSRAVSLTKYAVKIPKSDTKILLIPIRYKGIIKHEIVEGAAEYARGFSETSGIIFEKGVYLAGSTFWVPSFEVSEMSTFDLTVKMDKGWSVVSQGQRVKKELVNEKMTIKYVSPEPMDEIYLIAGKWTEYSLQHKNILVQAFLRTPDEDLANRYLEVTADYIRQYEDLIGEYPYTKFALVENFWETGYGMPSFTLLGEKVIRFPWILHSSYPHELLHNYWGNSVFVDYKTGNWCEGITVYMADHLIKEKQGIAGEYRRTTLQKYTDYVNDENDFPVSEFLSRNNSAQEAIGYGKCMMFNEMLRYQVGDDHFKEAYAKFYTDNRFKKASFSDIRRSFEEVTDQNLQQFFDQWISRKGAPTIALSDVSVKETSGKFIVRFKLSQMQDGDVFDLLIPVVSYLEGENTARLENISFSKQGEYFSRTFDKRPLKIEIDPQFNVFRRLDRSEVPTSLSQIIGSRNGIIVLPKSSKNLKEYEDLAKMWNQMQAAQGMNLEIVFDAEIESLPSDKAAWILGFENKFAAAIQISKEYIEYFDEETAKKINTAKNSGSLVYTLPNPKNNELTIGFIGSNNPPAISSLSRKLLHYGKYGYLAFEGDGATNTLTGTFPIIASPLIYTFKYGGQTPKIDAKLEPRKALVY